MKALLIVVAMLATTKSFAADSLAKLQFGQMTAAQALNSPLFDKEVWSIHMPGSNTWANPNYDLCMKGNTVMTDHAVVTCVQWTAVQDGDTKSFNSQSDAESYGSDVKCSAQTSKVLSTPVHYTEEVCGKWAVEVKGAGPAKIFTSLMKAEDFADSDDAQSSARPACIGFKTVAKTMPTSYPVKFYTRGSQGDSSELLGTYTYAIRACGTAAPVPAN